MSVRTTVIAVVASVVVSTAAQRYIQPLTIAVQGSESAETMLTMKKVGDDHGSLWFERDTVGRIVSPVGMGIHVTGIATGDFGYEGLALEGLAQLPSTDKSGFPFAPIFIGSSLVGEDGLHQTVPDDANIAVVYSGNRLRFILAGDGDIWFFHEGDMLSLKESIGLKGAAAKAPHGVK